MTSRVRPDAARAACIAEIGTRHVPERALPCVPMQHVWTLLVLVAAAINLAPVVGAFSPDRMATLYGVALEDPSLQVLMRHRAGLFGIVGGLLLFAAFHPPLRAVGYAVGFASMLSFLLIARLVGGYSQHLERVVAVDLVGIASLAGAALVHALWLRAGAARPPSGPASSTGKRLHPPG